MKHAILLCLALFSISQAMSLEPILTASEGLEWMQASPTESFLLRYDNSQIIFYDESLNQIGVFSPPENCLIYEVGRDFDSDANIEICYEQDTQVDDNTISTSFYVQDIVTGEYLLSLQGDINHSYMGVWHQDPRGSHYINNERVITVQDYPHDYPTSLPTFTLYSSGVPIHINSDVEPHTSPKLNIYPNPSSGNPVHLNWEQKSNGLVSLDIYNIRGQKVRSLVKNERCLPGKQAKKWDGLDDFGKPLSSGFYIYQLEIDGNKQVKKSIILK